MSVINFTEARRRRDEHAALIASAVEWILTAIPFRIPWADNPDFHSKWPGLDRSTLGEIEAARAQRLSDLQAALALTVGTTEAAVDAAVGHLPGRRDQCDRAATWLDLYPDRDPWHPDFERYFGDMTSAEMVLVSAERMRRIIRASGAR